MGDAETTYSYLVSTVSGVDAHVLFAQANHVYYQAEYTRSAKQYC